MKPFNENSLSGFFMINSIGLGVKRCRSLTVLSITATPYSDMFHFLNELVSSLKL